MKKPPKFDSAKGGRMLYIANHGPVAASTVRILNECKDLQNLGLVAPTGKYGKYDLTEAGHAHVAVMREDMRKHREAMAKEDRKWMKR